MNCLTSSCNGKPYFFDSEHIGCDVCGKTFTLHDFIEERKILYAYDLRNLQSKLASDLGQLALMSQLFQIYVEEE
jgi:hypothetical protein